MINTADFSPALGDLQSSPLTNILRYYYYVLPTFFWLAPPYDVCTSLQMSRKGENSIVIYLFNIWHAITLIDSTGITFYIIRRTKVTMIHMVRGKR